MSIRTSAVIALAVLLVGGGTVAAVVVTGEPDAVAAGGGLQLVRTQSGQLVDDPFTSPVSDRVLQDRYEFNGDLDPSRASVHATGDGLLVGVNPTADASDFLGWFAVTLDAYPKTSIFHVRMSKPPGNVSGPGQAAESVFAVQTAATKVTGLINFVEVITDSLNGETSWQVDYSSGKVLKAASRLYWSSTPSAVGPDTRDVTLRTDGRHSLTVWLGDQEVFSSDALTMDMEAPFQVYLEVQALRVPYLATFHDFWVAADDTLQLAGLPAGAQVALDGTDGTALARAGVDRTGAATLTLPPYAARGEGRLVIDRPGYPSARLGPFRYTGGDHFRIAGS